MHERLLWSIGGGDLLDTYKEPNLLGDVVWNAAAPRGTQRWPRFHPSEADPEGGYRLHPYTVVFALEGEPHGAYVFRLRYLAIAPRLAYLDLDVNGVRGVAYLRPEPSPSNDIRLQSGLHTSIYAEGMAAVVIPPALLRQGENWLTLTARDGGEQIVVERIEAIRRLDRMANGAGFVYERLGLAHLPEPPANALASAEIRPAVVYQRNNDGTLVEHCHLYLELSRDVAPGSLWLDLEGEQTRQSLVLPIPATAYGHLHLPFDLADGDGPVGYALRGELGGEGIDLTGSFARRRKWTVYVAPHVHTDIGYTHRQWEVAERLCRTIDAALDLLDADDGAKPGFAFHLDSTWALETYRQSRAVATNRRFDERIAAGQIGVPAGYVDLLTHLAALEDLIRNIQIAAEELRPVGLHPDFATVVDVASLSGALPALLSGAGVRYLAHASNQDRGPFRLNGGLHRRSPFFWQGTHGGAILVWLAKMYCELRKVCGSPPLPSAAERGLDLWLAEYERPDYAPDAVLLYGQEADNTDLDPQPAAFVHRWNRTYAYPRLVPSTVADFFRDVEARFGASFPAIRGDGGAYWEDGAGSTQAATARIRHAQAALPAAETLESLAVLHADDWAFPQDNYDEAWRQLLLADEHTWGAFLSCRDPDALLQRDQWATKEHMVDDAAHLADRLLHVAATRHSLNWNNDGREVVVYNPHSWTCTGPITVEIGARERVLDPVTGADAPTRLLAASPTQATAEIWIDDLPGLSYRRLVLTEDGEPPRASIPGPIAGVAPVVLENDAYRLTVDPRRAVLTSWMDKALGQELVDGTDAWGFGQLLHASGGEGTRLVSNQADLPDGDPSLRGDFALAAASIERFAYGTTLRLSGDAPYGGLTVEWTLHDRAKRIDLHYVYNKQERREKEAVYVAFPFALPDARVRSDAQLGWVDWDRDELPGGCKEWLPLQTGILVRGDAAAALVCSPDIPLFCVGDVVRGRWPRTMDLTGGRVFSYVLNNYWDTNYKASQGGPLSFAYQLTSDGTIGPDRAFRLGWQARRPLYAQRMSFQDFRHARPAYDAPAGSTLARIGTEQVVLTAMKPGRWAPGWIVRLREIAGRGQIAPLAVPGRRIARAWQTNLIEEEIAPLPVEPDGSVRIPVPAFGLTTVRIETASWAEG